MVQAPPSSGYVSDLTGVVVATLPVTRKLAAYIAEAAILADVLADNGQADLGRRLMLHCAEGVQIIDVVMDLTAPPDAIDALIAAAIEATERGDDTGVTDG